MPAAVHRVEVRPKPGRPDSKGAAAQRDAAAIGLPRIPAQIHAAGVYLLHGDLTKQQLDRIARELLADPVTEQAIVGSSPPLADAMIEVHPLPGVMDPAAEAIEQAIHAMLGQEVSVRTGQRYDMTAVDIAAARTVAERCLANTLIHAIHTEPYHPRSFPAGAPYQVRIVDVPLRDLDDAALEKLSRQAHLFLSLAEMKAIQAEYRRLGREPREIELETIAQTWSEHCVHKTLKATIRYREEPDAGVDHGAQRRGIAMPRLCGPDAANRFGHERNADGSITIHNLLKSTVAAATHRLMSDKGPAPGKIDWCLSVFEDNAGVIAFDDKHAVCIKVETHNHPSALEPYGGAATGIGGCIRDIIGTGLGARPIAATDVFCVAHPDHFSTDTTDAAQRRPRTPGGAMRGLPAGVLHPRRILTQVVRGVRDYGNRMGIPTLNGAVWFHDDYVGNPLVFCGTIGVMPRDKIKGRVRRGDRIIALGGRTGRDGIHGATFSSAELTDTHADEFSHAVQIGNAITEKKLLDAILEARDHESGCLYHAITDCGAGGFSSAVGEMGRELGAYVQLERAPLKYDGLTATEIWISEAQERMVLAVPPANVAALRAICDAHDVELCDLGEFGTPGTSRGELILTYDGAEIGRLSMEFLHDGLPEVVREAVWTCAAGPASRHVPVPVTPGLDEAQHTGMNTRRLAPDSPRDALLQLLAHPNVASKHWIIRQYDHEVQGGSVIKPLVGPRGDGPSDASVILPAAGSTRGLAVACGLATGLSDDPYVMTLAAIDECVRNLVSVGADPRKIAILDNFSWPGVNDPGQLAGLVRAAEACYDGAIAFRTPFVSGKDSLNNQFTAEDGTTIRIPPTLLITGIGIVPNVTTSVTMDAKAPGNLLLAIGGDNESESRMGGSHYEMLFGDPGAPAPRPVVNLTSAPQTALALYELIQQGLVRSAHDISDGGLLVAAAEMAMAGGLGVELDLGATSSMTCACFSEAPSRYLIEIEPRHLRQVQTALGGTTNQVLGAFNKTGRLSTKDKQLDVSIDEIRAAWRGTLDW